MSAKVPKINVTKNYGMFGRSEHNRALCPHKHKPLLDSMRAYGFLPEFPIVCVRDEKKHLIVKDGQHRLAAAESLGLPVYWVEETVDWDVAKVNGTVKNWIPLDFAERFARQGNKDYQEGLDFMREHRIPLGMSFGLLAGTKGWKAISSHFFAGTYKIKDRPFAEKVATIYRVATALNRQLKTVRFIEALMSVCYVKGFDVERLLHNMEKCREKLVPYSTSEAYLEMIEEVYNFRRRDLCNLKNEAIMATRARMSPKGRQNGKAE